MVKVRAEISGQKRPIFAYGDSQTQKNTVFLRFLVSHGVPGGAGMAEISDKLFFHRLQPQTHIFPKFHFSIIFAQPIFFNFRVFIVWRIKYIINDASIVII